MANTTSAKKAIRQIKRKTAQNLVVKNKIKALIRSIKTNAKSPDILKENYKQLQSALDKAVKTNVIHRNKAARMKSRILKLAHGTNNTTNNSKGAKGAKKSSN